jgi:predicted transcriptional regulator
MSRYTIDLDDDFDRKLTELQAQTGSSSKADVIRKAVASYDYLKRQVADQDKTVSITRDNEILKDVVLP